MGNIKWKFYNMKIFCEVIKNQEIDKKEREEFIVNYVKRLKKLCYNFKEWFSNKQGRDRKKIVNLIINTINQYKTAK